MVDFSALMGLKNAWSVFQQNHPRVPEFIRNVSGKGFTADQEIAIAVRYPDGTEYKTGIRVTESDLQLLETLKSLAGKQRGF